MASAPAIIEDVVDPNMEPANSDTPAIDAAAPTDVTPPASDDWRSRMAGDDQKLLGFLGRYQSEKAFVEAAKKDRDAARAKSLAKLPDNPTDEELTAYRAEHGIPEAPEGYYEKLAEGLVVGDDDKPFVDQFMKEMFGAHAQPAVVNAALDAYYGIVEEQAAAEAEFARQIEQASIEDLREEWGPDYKRNLNIMTGYLEQLPVDVQNIFKHGRMPEFNDAGEPTGRMIPIGYSASTVRWLTSQALEANPVATVVPGAGSNQASAIAEEMNSIRAKMGTPEYTKNPEMQARYLQLVEAQQKMKGAA